MLKDLRYMQPQSRREFFDIVLAGTRKDKDMAGFADKLSRVDAEAINAYVIIRALKDRGESR